MSKYKVREINRSYTAYEPGKITNIVAHKPGSAWNDAQNLVRVNYIIENGHYAGKVIKSEYSDGTITLNTYTKAGKQETFTTITGATENGNTVSDGTKVITVYKDELVMSVETIDVLSGETIGLEIVTRDPYGRETRRDFIDGTHEATNYACCGVSSFRDRGGNYVYYDYDGLGRLIRQEEQGVITETDYNDFGFITETRRIGRDGDVIKVERFTHYDNGQMKTLTDAKDQVTEFGYSVNQDGEVTLSTKFPNGSEVFSVKHNSGHPATNFGSGTVQTDFEYGVEYDDELQYYAVTATKIIGETWVKSYVNFYGETYKIKTSSGAVSRNYYDAMGRVNKAVGPDGETTLFNYNDRGEVFQTALDLNRNGEFDYDGTDRIVETDTDVSDRAGQPVIRQRTWEWLTNDEDSKTLMATSEVSIDGFDNWLTTFEGTTHSQSAFLYPVNDQITAPDGEAYSGEGAEFEKITHPDGAYSVVFMVDDLLRYSAIYAPDHTQLSRVDFEYDQHDRRIKVIDARNGTTQYFYDDLDQLDRLLTPDPDGDGPKLAQEVSNQYNSMGWLTASTTAAGTVNYDYDLRGNIVAQYGANTIREGFEYNSIGQLVKRTSWKDYFDENGDQDKLESSTYFQYHPDSGLLTDMIYPSGKSVKYTYTAGAKLKTKKWARGVTQTYDYNNAGEVDRVTYSDTTASKFFTYNRRGLTDTMEDASGTYSMTYTTAGQLDEYTVNSGFLAGLKKKNHYDGLLRLQTRDYSLSDTVFKSVSYGYARGSELKTISADGFDFSYDRHANSDLISTISYKQADSTVLSIEKQFDKLNRLTRTATKKADNSIVNSRDYDVNNKNRRVRVDLQTGDYWTYEFDDTGQLTKAEKFDSTDSKLNNYDYNYDTAGDRQNAQLDGQDKSYLSNILNQYTGLQDGPQYKYDDDGNLIESGFYVGDVLDTAQPFSKYKWDGDNNLIEIEQNTQKLEFFYNGSGIRTAKKVYTGSTGNWSLADITLFVYDGFELIAELDENLSPIRSYTWGLDIGGGASGLLSMKDHGDDSTYFYSYDGNGNVIGLHDSTSGDVVQTYSYSPYGAEINGPGITNPFRFSTQYHDDETGLVYYGLRYYNSTLVAGSSATQVAPRMARTATASSKMTRLIMLMSMASSVGMTPWIMPHKPGTMLKMLMIKPTITFRIKRKRQQNG